MVNRSILLLCTLTLTIAATSAKATIVTYGNRATFEAAAGAVTTQTFNSFPAGTDVFLGITYDFGDFWARNDANPTGGGDIVSSGVVNGSTELVGLVTLAGAKFTFMFDFPITALGFDATDIADQKTDRFRFNNAANNTITFFDPLDQTRFFGFISNTPFTTFSIETIATSSGTDGFRVDDVTYSTAAVPEVSSFFLVGLFGIALLGIAKLRSLVRGARASIPAP